MFIPLLKTPSEVKNKLMKLFTIQIFALLFTLVNAFSSPLYAQEIKEKTDICQGCHGVKGEGGIGPKLAGETADELFNDLMSYKDGTKTGPQSSLMSSIVEGLNEEDLKEIAIFFSNQ